MAAQAGPTPSEDQPQGSERGSFDSSAAYRVDPEVSLRPERFGALAYHYRTRRLTFLRSPLLVEVVERLEKFPSLDAAVDSLVPEPKRNAYRKALATLAASEFILTI